MAFNWFLPQSGVSQTTLRKNQLRLKALRETIIEKVKQGEVASLSIAVAQKGEVIWEESFGWADKGRKIKATPSTVYPVASLSKSITATGVFLMASQHKVNLEDAVHEHLRSVQITYDNCVTQDLKVFHLLNMAGASHICGDIIMRMLGRLFRQQRTRSSNSALRLSRPAPCSIILIFHLPFLIN